MTSAATVARARARALARYQAMSEADLQTNVTDAFTKLDFEWFHDNDSRRNKAGLPDLIAVHRRTGRLIFVELKSATGKERPKQKVWLAALGIRHEAYLWRPADWLSGDILRILQNDPARAAVSA